MSDVVVTVPKPLWPMWLEEGVLPGEESGGMEFHFWLSRQAGIPAMRPGDRVYVVAYGHLRGYAPLVRVELSCRIRSGVACLVRRGGAVAVTLPLAGLPGLCAHSVSTLDCFRCAPARLTGFRGWRTRWWDREAEVPFPDWRTAGVR